MHHMHSSKLEKQCHMGNASGKGSHEQTSEQLMLRMLGIYFIEILILAIILLLFTL